MISTGLFLCLIFVQNRTFKIDNQNIFVLSDSKTENQLVLFSTVPTVLWRKHAPHEGKILI